MSSPKSNELVKAVAAANEKFSNNLNQELSKESKGNLVYSPMSITTVLTLLKAGAKGQSEADLQKVLNLPADSTNVNKGYLQLLKSFQAASDAVTLKSANRVYTNLGFELNTNFVKTAKDYFLSEVEQLDFAKGHESAKRINGWVEEYTNKKIKDLIPPDCLTPLTRLVLVNGVYFKGLWKNQFDKSKTEKQTFYITEKETKEVDMMYMQEKFPYTELEGHNTSVVALPYKGDRLCMLVYLPDAGSNIAKLETSLKTITVESVLKDMRSHDKVQLSLPRFKVESTHNLVPVLKQLGLKSIFDAKSADFGNIPKGQDQLYVSEVIQKAFIEVNEEGTEAAAATGVVAMLRMMPHIIEFKANRPFLFQIVDKESNFILFAGKCANPSA